MCQHSWYDKNRRHYGRKPNTRRARGLRNRNFGIKTGPADTLRALRDTLPEVSPDLNVKKVPLPTERAMKRYAKMYNWYVRFCDIYRDNILSREKVAEKFKVSMHTVIRAIDTCKYVLALCYEEPSNVG